MSMHNLSLTSRVWSDEQHELLGRLADMVVPRGDDMPSATDVDVHTVGVERVAAMRPDLVTPVNRIIEGSTQSAPPDLVALIADYPEEFPAFAELVAGAFYLDPRVGEKLGYHARKALPLGDLDAQELELATLVGPVVGRGNTWRETPA